jgi:hypothetical protein
VIGKQGQNMESESRIRAGIEEHWRAAERGEIEAEHAIYAADAVLDYPQSGERFRGRSTIAAQRGGHPADRHFTVLRILGSGNLWVSECVITYDRVPTFAVSVMEFADEHVVHETQYFANTFSPPAWRQALAEPMPDRTAPVVAAVTTSRTEADLIVGLLHSYGLHAAVSADDAGGQEPQLQLQGVRVLVAPSDEAAARDVLAGSAHLGADPEPLHRLREGEGLGVDEKVGGEPGIGHDAPGPTALHREVPRVVEREDD